MLPSKQGEWEIALDCANLSEAIYADAADASEHQLEQLDLFEEAGLRAGVYGRSEHIIVVFRGSANARNWLQNAKVLSKDIIGGAVHMGFHDSMDRFYDDIVKSIQFHGEKKQIHVCGHSLGGAMAILFAYEASIRDDLELNSVTTFGQPLALGEEVAAAVNSLFGDRYWRFVFNRDPVTRLIPTFHHAGKRIHFTSSGAVESAPIVLSKDASISSFEAMSEEEFYAFQRAINNQDSTGLEKEMQPRGNLPFLADHKMKGYIEAVEKLIESANAQSSIAAADSEKSRLLPGQRSGKVALLVGINDYASPSISDLKGCVPDVFRMKELLITKFGFEQEDILVLLDQEASGSAIVEAFKEHLIQYSDGDKVALFYFSGHGSQMPDGPNNDELDHLDETIVPADSRQPGKYDISDDQLNGLVQRLSIATKHATVMLDCCHSGSGTKTGYAARSLQADPRDPPNEEVYSIVETRDEDSLSLFRVQNCALVFGCRDGELSYEMNLGEEKVRSGVLTYYFVEACRKLRGVLTYRSVMDYVKGSVERQVRFQHPQLEGTKADTEVFGVREQEAAAYFRVDPQPANNQVLIHAGAIHGVTKGSVYSVFNPGAGGEMLGQANGILVRVEQIKASTSKAMFVDEKETRVVAPGSRAFEVSHAYNNSKVDIYIGNPFDFDSTVRGREVIESIRRTVSSNKAILNVGVSNDDRGYLDRFEVVDNRADAKLFVACDAKSIAVFGGAVDAIGSDGFQYERWSTPVSLADPDADEKILVQVVRWSQWFERLELSNPAIGPKIDFAVKPLGVSDSAPNSLRVVPSGSRVQFRLINNHSRKLYFAILDFSTDGQIGMIFPPLGAPEQSLPPGRTWLDRGQLPSTPVTVVGDRTEVTDYFKVLVSEVPFRLDPLVMPPIGQELPRAERRGLAAQLERLVDQVGGIRERQGATIGLVDNESWSTSISSIRVLSRQSQSLP
ncbi:MAG: caspase family protein [Planctomycetota bacterium]